MRILAVILIFIFSLTGCKERQETNNELEARLYELEREVDSLSERLRNEKNPDFKTVVEQKDSAQVISVQQESRPNAKPSFQEKKEVKVVKTTVIPNDTTYYYYLNGKVSVKIHPWISDRRKIELFDLYGNRTYETEDIKLSYTQFNSFKFHKNGGVMEMTVSMNPGASLYHFTDRITFSSTNSPIVMYKSKLPQTLEDAVESQIPWFWNKRTEAGRNKK